MDLKEYLTNLVLKSEFLEKASIYQNLTILWYLKEEANKEQSENFLNEIQKTIKENLKGVSIEFKIVDEIEIAKEEIIYSGEYLKEGENIEWIF